MLTFLIPSFVYHLLFNFKLRRLIPSNVRKGELVTHSLPSLREFPKRTSLGSKSNSGGDCNVTFPQLDANGKPCHETEEEKQRREGQAHLEQMLFEIGLL